MPTGAHPKLEEALPHLQDTGCIYLDYNATTPIWPQVSFHNSEVNSEFASPGQGATLLVAATGGGGDDTLPQRIRQPQQHARIWSASRSPVLLRLCHA
jgi:hypothetical protein